MTQAQIAKKVQTGMKFKVNNTTFGSITGTIYHIGKGRIGKKYIFLRVSKRINPFEFLTIPIANITSIKEIAF